MGIKITASEERVFRLQTVSGDDTIILDFGYHSSECYLPVPVGAGAGFLVNSNSSATNNNTYNTISEHGVIYRHSNDGICPIFMSL